MTTPRILLSIAISSGLALPATLAAQTPDLRPMAVTGMTGSLRVQQDVPCDDDLDTTTPLTGGRLELTPTDGVPVAGGRLFTLTRGNLTFAGFSASRSCLGISRTRTYGEIGVQLSKAVSFTAAATGTPGVFTVTIPKGDLEINYATIVDGDLERATKNPSQDVTGTIDLALGTVSMHVVLATEVHFEAGCAFGVCIIDETDRGTLTADLAGTIAFPDTDADGVADRTDNCRFVANADQTPVPTPALTAPVDVTLASCLSRDFGSALGADVCDGTPVTVSSNAPAQFALGANTVTWTALDGLNRTATATQTVTIADATRPTFTFVPLDLSLNDCSPANLGTATAADDCAGTPTITNNAPAKFFVGTTPVTWTATDVSGNSATATQQVTVIDTVAPTVACAAASIPGSSFLVSAADSCTSTPVIRLGSFELANGETVMIDETGQPGVRLIGTVKGGTTRHFLVGKGEAVITATDPSGNVALAACSR